MKARKQFASWRILVTVLTALSLFAAACGSDSATSANGAGDSDGESAAVLRIGAIPDQEPERLQRTYGLLADYLGQELDVDVEYVPVTEYQGAVTAFEIGDLDAVWFGGLTGVQARLEVDGSSAIVQRDIDEQFTSVFIANPDSGIAPIDSVDGLAKLAGHSFTFGSESSTSGRLMPQSFLESAGIDIESDFTGAPGYSGSHDATIEVVAAGSFETGALNSQVWDARVAEGTVDQSQVIEIFRTPTYYDYHWVAQPSLDDRFGDGFGDELVAALTSLDATDEDQQAILELFGAGSFIVTSNENYDAIEAVARDVGLIRE